jgi:protein-disulfide isomerase
MQEHMWKIITGVAIIGIVAAFWYADRADKAANEGIELTTYAKGGENAAVVLTEYADFQCPACAQAFPLVKQLNEQHGDALKIEFKHFPLINIHPHAMPAARAAEAAGQQGKFWEMHDKLFENQSAWSNSTNPAPFFIRYAEELGLDVERFKTQMGASKIDTHIRESFENARGLGLTGTPSFLLNGQKMEFSSYDEFLEQVAAAVNAESETATSTDETSG